MKKKIVTLCLVIALAATAVIGGTLAYFTDTDEATNTFTSGKVDITLVEEFDADNAKLLPGSVDENAVQKDVSITLNEGSEDSYVWYEWLIPAVLDDADASKNIVHVNSWGATWDTYASTQKYIDTWNANPGAHVPAGTTTGFENAQTWDHTTIAVAKETVDGMEYNKYTVLYHGKLSAGESTTSAMRQVYMDSKVDTNENGEYTINGKVIGYDFSEGVNIIVRAYGIQAAGMADVYEAYNAYNAQ